MASSLEYETYNSIAWQEFLALFRWAQGEHVLTIAGTGQGKTTLLTQLVPYRKWNIVFGTKKTDKTYDKFLAQGFRHIQSVDEIRPWDKNLLLWPTYRTTIREFKARQRYTFQNAFDWVAGHGGWTVWNDEELYMCQDLKLTEEVTWFLGQARSSALTIINGSQRPAWIPVASYNGSTHAFLSNSNVDGDAKRLADLGLVHPRELLHNLKQLRRYEFVYVNTRDHGKPIRTKVELGGSNGQSYSSKRSGRLGSFSLHRSPARNG